MKRLVLLLVFSLTLVTCPFVTKANQHTIAQVIISPAGPDSAYASVSDSTSAPHGDDYSKYARKEDKGFPWKWFIALDLVVLVLILFAIMRRKRKK